MYESDDPDGDYVIPFQPKTFDQNGLFPVLPDGEMLERWRLMPVDMRRSSGYMLHVSVFWWQILLRPQEKSPTTHWAMAVGFLDANVSKDLSLKRLAKIEILELILDTIEILLTDPDTDSSVKAVLALSTDMKMLRRGCLEKVLRFLEHSGQPDLRKKISELGSSTICLKVLDYIFYHYSRYIQFMTSNHKMMMKQLSLIPEEWSIQKSEEMKNKGNVEFQKKKYDLALKWYTKAIKHHTNNHLLYGNRALCYIRCEKFLKAMGDGKRAIILQKDWAKGHYRFCDALFFMGAREKALNANLAAQSLCTEDSEGMKDLEQQLLRFQMEMADSQSKTRVTAASEGEKRARKTGAKKSTNKQPGGASGVDPPVQDVPSYIAPDEVCKSAADKDTKSDDSWIQQEASGSNTHQTTCEGGGEITNDEKSKMGDRKTKKGVQQASKKSVKSKPHPTQEKPQVSSGSCGSSSEVGSKEQFCAAVQDAHTALSDLRCHNAEQAFSLALKILDSTRTKDLGISELDKALLIYGHASALTIIGKPEELSEAQKQLNKLNSSPDRTFKSLVHYGFGKVFLKEHRFKDAKEEFIKAFIMLQRQIIPGKLTWPTTKVTVKETLPGVLQELLRRFIQMCEFPPKPDANCRHRSCLGHGSQIYFTEPDFKGFIQLSCSESCQVEFHINCWKKLKVISFPDKNDKDFLQHSCFTPDCMGKVCHIIIFDSTGLKKCEFKSSVQKSPVTGKVRVKQECTSQKKIKSKEDRKQKRKQIRAAESKLKKLTPEENQNKEADNVIQTSPQKCVLYSDRVLHQIYESRELFNDELLSITNILVCLRPWMELDESKGHKSALKDRAEPCVLRDLVDLLLETKNRVWARIFVQKLTECKNLKTKLYEWAQQLDNIGLNIADKFINQCSEHLKEFDFSPLLEFPPMQDLSEKFGPMPELLEDSDFTLTDYLRQAPPQEMRLFVWTLEEHRERYPACSALLDEYFEMDAVCLVIKKNDFDDRLSSVYKSKGRNRKKKHKESKSILVLSGVGSVQRDDEDFFSEEDSLMLLDDTEPFSVPNHLREQVAEFEGLYTGGLHNYTSNLDHHPDLAKENLYDYFEQILEEHGPLDASDALLVGELDNFPPEAQTLIETAGGLEPFLLNSLRFVQFDELIGLVKHAESLKHAVQDYIPFYDPFFPHMYEPTESSYLDPTAREFQPQSSPGESGASYDVEFHPDTCPTVPTPFIYYCESSESDMNVLPDISDTIEEGSQAEECPECLPDVPTEPYSFNIDAPNQNSIISYSDGFTYKEGRGSKHKSALFQTVSDHQDDVAINTEPFAPYENNNGDLTLTENQNLQMLKRIQNLKETFEILQSERKAACSELEEEVEMIRAQAEIAKTELDMFQRLLEEEVQKGQQEKKDHQEKMKVLKMENKAQADLNDSYSKQIQEMNATYQKEFDDSIEKNNQSAAEKSSLEDEIKKCQKLLGRATSRSLAAQTCVLHNKREHGLLGLRKFVSDGNSYVQHMMEISTRLPNPKLLSIIDAWKASVQEGQERIRATEVRYEEQIALLNKGTSLSSLPPVTVPSLPVSPPIPPLLYPPLHQKPMFQPLPVWHAHAPSPQPPIGKPHPVNTPASRPMHTPPVPDEGSAVPVHPQPATLFDKIIDRLSAMFPHYTRPVLSRFIQEVRTNNGGTLNMLTYEQVINRAAQLILDHQEQLPLSLAIGDGPCPTPLSDSFSATPTPPLAHVWKSVSSHPRSSSKALNTEDPCIICHDDMVQEDTCVLECRHSFHRECIKSWLKEQSTCPTCREHALLPEDFPMLPGRQRRGHAPAAS